MTGLILKDMYSLRSYFVKQILLMAVIYLLISVVMIQSFAFFAPMMVMSVMMMLISSFSFDETAKWDTYALTLPLSPRSIVGAKYLLMLGAMLGSSAVILLICAVGDALLYQEGFAEIAGTTAGIVITYLVMSFLVMPMFYKMGVEKARVAMILTMVAPFMLIVGGVSYLENAGVDFGALFDSVSIPMLAVGGVLLVIALGVGSYLLSVKFYSEKEY